MVFPSNERDAIFGSVNSCLLYSQVHSLDTSGIMLTLALTRLTLTHTQSQSSLLCMEGYRWPSKHISYPSIKKYPNWSVFPCATTRNILIQLRFEGDMPQILIQLRFEGGISYWILHSALKVWIVTFFAESPQFLGLHCCHYPQDTSKPYFYDPGWICTKPMIHLDTAFKRIQIWNVILKFFEKLQNGRAKSLDTDTSFLFKQSYIL